MVDVGQRPALLVARTGQEAGEVAGEGQGRLDGAGSAGRAELAACLPTEAARVLTAQIPSPQPLTGWAFVKDLATRSGAALAPARWDTGSVLAAVAAHAGPDLIT